MEGLRYVKGTGPAAEAAALRGFNSNDLSVPQALTVALASGRQSWGNLAPTDLCAKNCEAETASRLPAGRQCYGRSDSVAPVVNGLRATLSLRRSTRTPL
jgi:hypothetical protein